MATQIQLRRDTASNWTSNNPTLAAGEFGWESDTNRFKIGTGSSNWQSLGYASEGDTAGITFVGDDSTGTTVSQNETFKIAGTQNITAAVSGDTLTLTGPDLSTYLTASSSTTLTNKTIDADNNTVSNIEVDNLKSGVLDTDISSVAGTDTTLASAKAIKTYVDAQVAGKDNTDEITEGSSNLYFTNARADARITNALLDEDNMASDSATKIPSQQSVKAYVDSQVATKDALGELSGDTDDVSEGSTNLYFTNARADARITNAIKDEDNMASDSATHVPSQQSVKAYVDAGDLSLIDEDNFSTDSASRPPSQQSVKAYVDAQDAAIASDTLTLTNKTFDVEGTGNSISNIDVADFKAAAIVLESEGIGSNDNDTPLPTSAAVKDYVDTQITAEDLDVAADSGTAAVDLDSQSLTVTGGTGIGTTATGQAVTINIDSTVATLTGSQTLTNKVLTSPTINSPTIATPTITGAMTATSVTTNDVTTNGSNADLDLAPQGTGKVKLYGTYTFPTSDGSNGTALVTDGSGTLSFGSVGSKPVSDDGAAVAITDKRITSTARTIDSFHSSFQDSVLYYVVSNDHNEDAVNVQKVSVCHNDSGAFISSAGALSKASTSEMTTFTAGLDNDMVRVKAASTNAVGGTLSFYKFGLGDNTSTGTSGNVIISQNTDVDSASESLVSFAHATFRGAKLFVSVNNASKTEVGNVEALVVHDGSDAFISQFGGIQTGNNALITLTAAIDGSNVVVSAAGLETNLRVTVHAIMLKDTMTSNSGTYANAEAIAPVTISSSATEIDTLVEASNNGAVYYLVSKNASEGEYAVNEVFVACGSGEITVASGPYVSTKGTNQLAFTTDYKDDVENTGQLFASSTSGGSTTVSAYRINLLAK